tara:strand:+ start:248317 stop:248577 length:261 start_codon:yes stop_codon:yes gene_type:complete
LFLHNQARQRITQIPRLFTSNICVYPRVSAANLISESQAVGSGGLRLELNLPVVGGFVLSFAALQFSGTILRFLNTPSGHSLPLFL